MSTIDGVLPFLCFCVRNAILKAGVYVSAVLCFFPPSRSEKPMESGGGGVCSWQELWHML